MSAVRLVSDPGNYHEFLKEADQNEMIRVTHNGDGACSIMSIREADKHERLKALHEVLSDLDRAKRRADREGWIEEVEIDKVLCL